MVFGHTNKILEEHVLKALIFAMLVPITAFASNVNNVALVSSSTQFDDSQLPQIQQNLEQKGYSVSLQYLDQVISDFGYVNTDQKRAKDLIRALTDDNIDILWFVRGGGGALNLLPYLEQHKDELKLAKPKVLVGFSDVTALHHFVNQELGWPSIHGVTAATNLEMGGFNQEPLPNISELLKNGVEYDYVLPLNDLAKTAKVNGTLVGGNHTLVAATFGTKYSYDFKNKVLLLEDVGVSFRQLDRLLQQILFLNQFDVNAVIFGQYYPADPTDPERLMYKTVLERFAQQLNKPVYYFPFIGHGKYNRPVILGHSVELSCKEEYCNLTQ